MLPVSILPKKITSSKSFLASSGRGKNFKITEKKSKVILLLKVAYGWFLYGGCGEKVATKSKRDHPKIF